MNRSALRSLWYLVVAATLAACGSDDAGNGNQPDATSIGGDAGGDAGGDGGADSGPDLTVCVDNLDCRGGEVCRDGFCREACASDADCTAPTPVCDEALGYCVAPECATDADCPGGTTCEGVTCVPIDPVVCEPDTSTCEGQSLVSCNRDGTRETRATCAADEICVDNGDGDAKCAALVCDPNALGCSDDETAFVCDATGTQRDELPCDDGDYCIDGVCLARICEPDSVVCEGNSLVACDALGGSRDVTPCSELDACATSAAGCVCRGATCTPRVCRPGTARCVGSASQTCAADGLSYEAPVACDAGALCVAGACITETCTPGATECAGDSVATCAADGSDRTLTDCTLGGEICVAVGGAASCGAPVCVPDSTRCAPDAEAVVVCDARGAGESTVACGPDSFCADGACSPSVCDAGDPPVCFGGDVWECDPRGSGFDLVETCTDGALCVSGECRDVVCTPGPATCSGETLVSCSADGTTRTEVRCDLSASYCDSATRACVPRVCDPASAPRCVAGDAVSCNARGSAELVLPCGSSGCVAGACLSSCGDGVVEGGEECDEGAANGPAGSCDALCRINDAVLCDGFEDAYCFELGWDGPGLDVSLPFTFDESSIDVAFNMDVTGSMGTEITELRTEFGAQIVPSLRATFPRSAFSVTSFADVPCGSFGSPGDNPFALLQRVTTRTGDVQTAIDGLVAAGGNDGPESGWESLYQLASGNGRTEPGCAAVSVPSFNPAASFIAGIADGSDGGVGFRPLSRRVVVHVTDAASQAKSSVYPYGARRAEAISALRRVGARVVTIDSSTDVANVYLRDLATETGATVPPCAWDAVGRPSGCASGQCCTGDGGAGQSTDASGLCPLAYLTGASPTELDVQITDALALLTQFATWNVTVVARPDAAELAATGFDTSCFVDSVTAVTADPNPGTCVADPSIIGVRSAGARDGFANVVGGSDLSFDVAFNNSCAPATSSVQAYTVYLDIVSPGGYALGTQPVRVVVPPVTGCDDCPGTCGNGSVDAGEECDDGNTANGDGCTSLCTLPRCGDGIISVVSGGEIDYLAPSVRNPNGSNGPVCDDGASCPQGTCSVRADHTAVEHGLCQALGHERAVSATWGGGSGSTTSPMPHAVNWSCFDFDCGIGPDTVASDDCGAHEMLATLTCESASIEACDDGAGNSFAPNACRPDCSLPRCGDGVRDAGEACDDGNTIATDACTNTCTARRCGDGIVATTEACDDGNTTSGDGCSSTCVVESVALTCADVDLMRATGTPVYTGSTVGRANRYTPTCLSSTGTSSSPDVTLSWQAPAAGTYYFSTEGTAFDTVMSIRDGSTGSCFGTVLACNDDTTETDIFGTALRWSEATLTLAAGQVVLIVVDGYGTGTTGAVEVNISVP